MIRVNIRDDSATASNQASDVPRNDSCSAPSIGSDTPAAYRSSNAEFIIITAREILVKPRHSGLRRTAIANDTIPMSKAE